MTLIDMILLLLVAWLYYKLDRKHAALKDCERALSLTRELLDQEREKVKR